MTSPATQEPCPNTTYGNRCSMYPNCACNTPSQRAELLTQERLDRIRQGYMFDSSGHGATVIELLQHIAALQSQLDAAKRENDFLRAYTGNSAKACVYCGLGAEEQGKCTSGFPGCARGDDQMLCREAAVGMERDELRKKVASLTQLVEAAESMAEGVFSHLHDNLCTCATDNDPCDWHKLWDAAEAYRALSQEPR